MQSTRAAAGGLVMPTSSWLRQLAACVCLAAWPAAGYRCTMRSTLWKGLPCRHVQGGGDGWVALCCIFVLAGCRAAGLLGCWAAFCRDDCWRGTLTARSSGVPSPRAHQVPCSVRRLPHLVSPPPGPPINRPPCPGSPAAVWAWGAASAIFHPRSTCRCRAHSSTASASTAPRGSCSSV